MEVLNDSCTCTCLSTLVKTKGKSEHFPSIVQRIFFTCSQQLKPINHLYNIRVAISASMIYTAPYVMFLMRAASITRASGRGLGSGKREFFGPCEMASSR
jgi:hypothetical protein